MRRILWSVLFVLILGESVWAQGWEPSSMVSLPSELMEVSALAEADEGRVACLQDEKGEIFIVDPERGVIEQRIAFGASRRLRRVDQNRFRRLLGVAKRWCSTGASSQR